MDRILQHCVCGCWYRYLRFAIFLGSRWLDWYFDFVPGLVHVYSKSPMKYIIETFTYPNPCYSTPVSSLCDAFMQRAISGYQATRTLLLHHLDLLAAGSSSFSMHGFLLVHPSYTWCLLVPIYNIFVLIQQVLLVMYHGQSFVVPLLPSHLCLSRA